MPDQIRIYPNFQQLNNQIIQCCLCPRLVEFRETVPAAPIHKDEDYWRKPVPGYGDKQGWLLILGLAPAIHGGNRTGRIFTGDKTSEFLVKVLYQAGFANQCTSTSTDDGLMYKGCYLTAVVKCVPPKHHPTNQECSNCSQYLINELKLLPNLTHVLALGKVAFDSFLKAVKTSEDSFKGVNFAHGARYKLNKLPILYASYHPTPRNTNTGTLTEKMFLDTVKRINAEHEENCC